MPNATQPATRRGARPARGAEILGVSLPTFWRYAKQFPDFPRPCRLSARCTVFDEASLVAWRDSRAVTEVKPAVVRTTTTEAPARCEPPNPDWRARIKTVIGKDGAR